MVDHVAEGIRVVEGSINALVIIICVQSKRKSPFRGQVTQLQDFTRREVDMLRLSMIHLPFIHNRSLEIIETSKDFPRHKPKKLPNLHSFQPLWQDQISASSTCHMLNLAISDDRLETKIIPQLCQMTSPQGLIHRCVLLQIPDWKFIGIDKRSTAFVGIAIDDHLSPSTVTMQPLEQVEQSFNMEVVCVFLLLRDSHVEYQLFKIWQFVVGVEPHCRKKGASVYRILEGLCQGISFKPFGDYADLVVKISPHLIIIY